MFQKSGFERINVFPHGVRRPPRIVLETAATVKFLFRPVQAHLGAYRYTGARARAQRRRSQIVVGKKIGSKIMSQDPRHAGNVVLLRGACLWLLVALVLAWCLVGLSFGLPFIKEVFPGKFSRVLQGHLDFLLMTALILGFYAAKTPLPWHVRWAMVIGAFTNSSLFLLQAMFPALDSPTPPEGLFPMIFLAYLMTSLVVTSYGFGKAAVIVFRSTFKTSASV
jgi:hypothetical protein